MCVPHTSLSLATYIIAKGILPDAATAEQPQYCSAQDLMRGCIASNLMQHDARSVVYMHTIDI